MSVFQSKILRGTELVKNRQAKQASSSSENDKPELENFYQRLEDSLKKERVQKLGELSVAVYNEEEKTIELTVQKGKFWRTMGYSVRAKKFLYPEEAVFLMESCQLELYKDKVPMSIQEARSTFFNSDKSQARYQTFSHLIRLGFVVTSHQNKNNARQGTALKRLSDQHIATDISEKKIKLFHEEINESVNNQASTSTKTRDFSDVYFPNCAGKWKFQLPVPSPQLLPPNVVITDEMCFVNRYEIEKNLSSDRKQIKCRKNENYEDEEYPKMFNWKNTTHRCWSDLKDEMKRVANVVPDIKLAGPSTSTVQLCTNVKSPFLEDSLPKIDYDVHLANEKFKKNTRMLPNHRLVVTKANEEIPTLLSLVDYKTKFNDCVPLQFCFHDAGDVSFFSLSCVEIPDLS